MSVAAAAGAPTPHGPGEERAYRREWLAWALLGVGVGLVDGATVAVLVKKSFAGLVAPYWVNLAVAVVSGAPALANISSFAWANLAHARARVRQLVWLQAGFALVIASIALSPRGAAGLWLTMALVIGARIVWAGVLTLRATVWTANYPRHVMARMTGQMVMAGSIAMAAVALLAGWVLDARWFAAQWLYLVAGACGLAAAWLYQAVRVRGEHQLLAAEAGEGAAGGAFSLRMLREILSADPQFRRYMFWMSLYGSGNLILNGQLVVLFTDRMHLASLTQILLLTVVPLLLMPLFLPAWASLFDRGHIIEYRARQCWALVGAIALLGSGVLSGALWPLWVGTVLLGISYAGANLGWNLGHNDFATLGRVQHYMGVHVTLTGVRGLIAPPLGMLCYLWLQAWKPGWGVAALLLPLGLVTAGAIGFLRMREQRAQDLSR